MDGEPMPRVWTLGRRTITEGDRCLFFYAGRWYEGVVIEPIGAQMDVIRVKVGQTSDAAHLDWIVTASDGPVFAALLQRVASYRGDT